MAYESVYLASEYVTVSCGREGCSQRFAMSRTFYDQTRRTGETWYCPSGHPRAWTGHTTEQKLAAAEARQRHLEDQLLASAQEAERVRIALVRDRHRFANGVCPCCNRSFENVARHMSTEHPDYDVTKIDQHAEPRYRCSCGSSFTTPRGLAIHQGQRRSNNWAAPDASRWRAHLTVV